MVWGGKVRREPLVGGGRGRPWPIRLWAMVCEQEVRVGGLPGSPCPLSASLACALDTLKPHRAGNVCWFIQQIFTDGLCMPETVYNSTESNELVQELGESEWLHIARVGLTCLLRCCDFPGADVMTLKVLELVVNSLLLKYFGWKLSRKS